MKQSCAAFKLWKTRLCVRRSFEVYPEENLGMLRAKDLLGVRPMYRHDCSKTRGSTVAETSIEISILDHFGGSTFCMDHSPLHASLLFSTSFASCMLQLKNPTSLASFQVLFLAISFSNLRCCGFNIFQLQVSSAAGDLKRNGKQWKSARSITFMCPATAVICDVGRVNGCWSAGAVRNQYTPSCLGGARLPKRSKDTFFFKCTEKIELGDTPKMT